LKGVRALALLSLAGIALLASHLGEFWPYSIYPMFSVAGRPWRRAIAREVSDVPAGEIWRTRTVETLVGRAFPVAQHGIPQIDFTEYVNHSSRWDDARVTGIRALFAAPLRTRTLLIYEVRGDVDDRGKALTEAEPVVLLEPTRSELPPDRDAAAALLAGETRGPRRASSHAEARVSP
jgi:hypothetical protein